MTKEDINRIFTEKVAALLAQGYQINASTMGGSQGEIAHVDLSNGNEILRVLLDRAYDCGEAYGEYFTITVGRNTDRIRGGWSESLWNNHLEILFQIKLAKITDTYFTTPEAAKKMCEKRFARWDSKRETRRDELGDAYKSVGLRWLRRQPKMRTSKLEDIESMVRITDSNGRISYEIKAKGKSCTLCAARA